MAKEKKTAGRPSIMESKYEDAKKYLMGGWQEVGDMIPSVAGLACYLGVSREIIYNWRDKDETFFNILRSILTLQERTLLNGGLGKDFNPVITKLVLGKHGYSDKQEEDNSEEVLAKALQSLIDKLPG